MATQRSGEYNRIENMGDNRGERLNLARDILLAIALAGGAVVLVAVAPGLGMLLKTFTKKYHHRSLDGTQLKRRLERLHKSGLVSFGEHNGKTKLYLTKAGQQRVLEYQVDEMVIPEQNPWDHLYRFVMFDIPEKKRAARDIFREKLTGLGFKKIQQSIWRHRYPCAKEIEFLANLYEIGLYVDVVEGRQVV